MPTPNRNLVDVHAVPHSSYNLLRQYNGVSGWRGEKQASLTPLSMALLPPVRCWSAGAAHGRIMLEFAY